MSQSVKTLHEFGSVSFKYSSSSQLKGTTFGDLAASGVSNLVLVQTTGAATASLGTTAIGTVKTVVLHTDGGDLVITPGTLVGGTTITLNDAGDSVSLVYTSAGWVITSNNGSVVA